MFVDTRNKGVINTQHVVRVQSFREKNTGEYSAVFHMSDGTTTEAKTSGDLESELAHRAEPVPAQPGYTLLAHYPQEDGEDWVERSPVIAWQVDTKYGGHDAISLIKPWGDEVSTAVLCPDGKVVEIGGVLYDDEDEWLKIVRAQAKADAERKKAQAAKSTAAA